MLVMIILISVLGKYRIGHSLYHASYEYLQVKQDALRNWTAYGYRNRYYSIHGLNKIFNPWIEWNCIFQLLVNLYYMYCFGGVDCALL